MNDYDTIQKQIREAKLQRAMYLGDLIASTIIASIEIVKATYWHTKFMIKSVANSIFKGASNRAPRSKNIFTFDA